MPEVELCPGRWVGNDHPVFIIAELGQNHQVVGLNQINININECWKPSPRYPYNVLVMCPLPQRVMWEKPRRWLQQQPRLELTVSNCKNLVSRWNCAGNVWKIFPEYCVELEHQQMKCSFPGEVQQRRPGKRVHWAKLLGNNIWRTQATFGILGLCSS